MNIRFKFDDTLINEVPDGWEKRVSSIVYDRTFKGRLIKEDATFEWFLDGYQYISRVFAESICDEIAVEIQVDKQEIGNWETQFRGIIKMPDCDFRISPNYVRTPILDNSFYARINNNKSIKTTVNNGRSKNDVEITPCEERETTLFVPSTGAYSYGGRTTYAIYDAFRYMIDFMTDGEVGFVSETFGWTDPFSPSGEFASYVLCLGIELRLGATNTDKFLELSFDDLFRQLDKKFNLGFRIEYVSGKPYMRIEKLSWFNKTGVSHRFTNINAVRRGVNSDTLFSVVQTGADDTIDVPSLQFPENTRWQGFRDEQFYLLGQCNIDKPLDLKSQWVISSNVIEDVVVNNSDAFDDSIFIIQRNNLGFTDAKQSNWLSGTTPPFFYNEGLINRNVIDRYIDTIPFSVAAQLGISQHRFRAINSSDLPIRTRYASNPAGSQTYTIARFNFDDDYTSPTQFDDSNDYGNGTVQGSPVATADSIFTASIADTYTFFVNYIWEVIHADNNMFLSTRVQALRYDSGNTLQETQNLYFSSQQNPAAGLYNAPKFFTMAMASGDYVEIKVTHTEFENVYFPGTYIQWRPKSGGEFACVFSLLTEGGQFTNADARSQPFMKYVLSDVPLSDSDFENIISDTSKQIEFDTNGIDVYVGWIYDLKYKKGDGRADVTLVGRLIDEPKNS